MNLCITTTATCRPRILDRTYNSFISNFIDIELRGIPLFINIDPAIDVSLREPTLEIAKKHFKNVYAILPKEPNFSKAVKTLWSFAKDFDLVFHLEDDYELLAPVKYKEIENWFIQNPKVIQVKLRRSRPALTEKSAFSLLPSIYRASFCYEFSKIINTNHNPEEELHLYQKQRSLGKGNILVYSHNGKGIIKDIGRKWRQKHNIVKCDDNLNFTHWIQR